MISELNKWSLRITNGQKQCKNNTLSYALTPRTRLSIKYALKSPKNAIPEILPFAETLLPRNFSWVVDNWLCGVSIPKRFEQIRCFEAMNIGLVVTFFETPLILEKRKCIDTENLKFLHIKTMNYKAPKMYDLDSFFRAAEECIFVRHKAVCIHCGGGKGRAGTGLAVWIIKWGLIFDKLIDFNVHKIPKWTQPQKNGTEAIRHVQTVRPGSIETAEQERFIKLFANNLWSKVHKNDECEEQKVKELDPTGLKRYPLLSKQQMNVLKGKAYPEMIILCGLPGSGKSLFCAMMNTLNKQQNDHKNEAKTVCEWRIANQDKLGSKEAVDAMVRQWLSDKMGKKICLIIDRCNVSKKERKQWIEMTFKIKKCVAVYFDIDAKICQERIYKRKNHETIQNRSQRAVAKVINDFSKRMEAPTKKEGFMDVITIKDTNDLLDICKLFGCLPEIIRHFVPTQYFKFPRTPHLWNTGAATRDDIRLDAKFQNLYFGKDAKTVIVTEKVDGANLGISLTANYQIECQHRGSKIVYNSSSEYSKLKDWLDKKSKYLCEILEPQRHILFGEWVQCKHSIFYTNLPDYFLVFDIYDRHCQSFVSRNKLESLCKGRFCMTQIIKKCRFECKEDIESLMNETMSSYKLKAKSGPIEGLYLKIDDEEKEINVHRCKLVRSEFIQGITEHWIHQKMVSNTIRHRYEFDECDNENNDEFEEKKVSKKQFRKKKFLGKNENNLYRAMLAKSRFPMSVKVICKKLKFQMDDVLNVYVIGSRVWGTAQSHSDWDIIIVLKTKTKTKFCSVGNIDAYCLDVDEWICELNNHRFVCWLTLFLPETAIWKSELLMDAMIGRMNGFCFDSFGNVLIAEIEKDCKKLNKFWNKGKVEKVFKTFVHTLRMIQVSKEMIALLKEEFGINEGKSAVIKCEQLVKMSFFGKIQFDKIEGEVREKQKEMQIGIEESKYSVNELLNYLKAAGKECVVFI